MGTLKFLVCFSGLEWVISVFLSLGRGYMCWLCYCSIMDIYCNPLYYEVAFSFFDVKKQVDGFERVIEKYSRARVKRCLDVCCGPSLQLRELAKRGYECVGLDRSVDMLEYLCERARAENVEVDTVHGDMCGFDLNRKVDFAFVMMGSLTVKSNDLFLRHLDSVAECLRKGGLYFVQNMMVDWTSVREQSWSMSRDGVSVAATFSYVFWRDVLRQLYGEKGVLKVNDHGVKKKLVIEQDLKFIFPEEFLALVKLEDNFEFVGWWEGDESDWFLDKHLEESERPSNFNMVLLRRK